MPKPSSLTTKTMDFQKQDYAHSPVHLAVLLGDHRTLTRLLSTLPTLTDPSLIHTESDSVTQEQLADKISSLIDRRDVPHRETPLHLAVRLHDSFSTLALTAAGADVSLQNDSGWNSLHEFLCLWRNPEIGKTLLRSYQLSTWSKWRRKVPRIVGALQKMRDFYMEISFHFESSVIPFVGKIAPSDTYKIWKREGNLRADTSLSGFDGLKIQRSDQSFIFVGDTGSLLVLNHEHKKIFNAIEHDSKNSECGIREIMSEKSVYRPGLDVTKAQLIGRTNWRKQEKKESVGDWKTKVFDVHNVVFSFRSRKISNFNRSIPNGEDSFELVLDEDGEEEFLVAENPRYSTSSRRRHSSFVREDREFISIGRKSLDIKPRFQPPPPPRPIEQVQSDDSSNGKEKEKEKEYMKSLRPTVWLTEDFPLKTEELVPLLDILAHRVKAVHRLRELLATKFPPGSFPVKVAIPVVPTVRVVITFTKFVELQRVENFYTPLSSPSHFPQEEIDDAQVQHQHQQHAPGYHSSSSSSSSSSWLRRTNSKQNQLQSGAHQVDPFSIPSDYTWANSAAQNKTSETMRKSRSTRKTKQGNVTR